MQAKKVISLLLTVAISVASSISVFAAPVDGYKQVTAINANLANAMTQAIHSGAAFADTEKIRADFTVEKITDAEVVENYGLDTVADAGVEPDMEGKGYKVTISLKDIGTLVRDSRTGFLMTQYGFTFNPKNGASYYVVPLPYSYNEQLTGDNFTLGANVNGYNITYAGTDAKYATSYPSTLNSTATDCDNAITLVVYADEGTVLTIDDAYAQFSNIEYKSMQYKPYQEGTTTPFDLAKYSLWVPETITLGTPGPVGPIVTKGETIEANNVTEYTFANSEEFKETKVLMTSTAATVSEKTRFYVSYNGGAQREFGSDIWEKLGQGQGSITVENIKFGLIVPAGMDASLFAFEVCDQKLQ